MANNFCKVACCLLLLGSLAMSCQKSPESKGYMLWVQDYANGMRIKKEAGALVLDLQYQPSPYVWMQQHGRFDRAAFDKEKEKLDEILYFTLSIGTADQSDAINALSADLLDKQRILYYFSYQFQNDVQLKVGDKTLSCVLYHFERDADMHNSRSIVLGFENKDNKSGDLQLVLNSERISPLPIYLNVSKNKTSL